MPDQNCPNCRGLGYTVREADGNAITCQCTVVEQIAISIKSIPGLQDVQKLGRGLVTFSGAGPAQPLKGSAIIQAAWSPMLEHVAGWLYASYRRGQMPKVHITSCSRLRSMYFGGHEDGKSSKLGRLEAFDLVVVRLIGTKHKATPEALLEALDYAKAIWLVTPEGSTFSKKHPAWSEEIGALVEGFPRVDLSDTPRGGGVMAKIGLAPKGGQDA